MLNRLLLVLFLPCCLANIASAQLRQNSKPNIILILADDLGYGDLSCYGQRKIRTPHLDRMASEGMRFTQHYAGSTVCAPSRAVLMTGLHTGHVSIKGNGDHPLQTEERTIAQTLKGAGYKTAILGKWGLGTPGTSGTPDKKGFDYFFGYLHHVHAHNHYPEYLWRNGQKVSLENKVKAVPLPYTAEPGGFATERLQYGNDLFTEEALNYIEQNRSTPFFLYLAYTIPHANNEAEDLQRMEVPSDTPYGKEAWPQPEKNKAAMITRLDGYVGRILQKLNQLHLDSNTLVIFTSDNGPHREGVDPEFFDSNGILRGIKRDLYEGGIRVPMIAWMPGTVKRGSVSDHVSAFWDMAPTMAELAGEKFKGDGCSFLRTLTGKGALKTNRSFYWQFNEGGENYALRKGEWKLLKLKKKGEENFRIELYNLKKDHAEKFDLSRQYSGIVRRMLADMKASQVSGSDLRFSGG